MIGNLENTTRKAQSSMWCPKLFTKHKFVLYYCYYYYFVVITFMHSIYNYTSDTNHISRVCSFAAVLCLYSVWNVLFHMWNKFCTLILVFSEVCVQCPTWLFFFRFPTMLLNYCLKDFEMGPVAPVIIILLSCSTCADFLLKGLYIY